MEQTETRLCEPGPKPGVCGPLQTFQGCGWLLARYKAFAQCYGNIAR